MVGQCFEALGEQRQSQPGGGQERFIEQDGQERPDRSSSRGHLRRSSTPKEGYRDAQSAEKLSFHVSERPSSERASCIAALQEVDVGPIFS